MPFEGFACLKTDETIQLFDSGMRTSTSDQYPESTLEQYGYKYQIRTGDFNSDEQTDTFIERLTPGPADGSMPSYVIWPHPGSPGPKSPYRTYTVATPSSEVERQAAQTQVSHVAKVNLTDTNCDGYPDHLISGFDLVMGEGFNSMSLFYAPGASANKTLPIVAPHLTKDWGRTYQELRRWLNDEDYIAKQHTRRHEPEIEFDLVCETEVVFPIETREACRIAVSQGKETEERIGITPATTAIASRLKVLFDEGISPTQQISMEGLWRLSNAFNLLIGSHICGFSTHGGAIEGNFELDFIEAPFLCFSRAIAHIR